MKAIIVEDELNVRMGFRKLIQTFCPEHQVVAEYGNVEESITGINKSNFDILFLDINLPDGSGFDILHRCDNKNFHTIFVTAYDQYAIDAFKMCAIDYLLKPVSPTRLQEAISKIPQASVLSSNLESHQLLKSKIDGDHSGINKIILKETDCMHIVDLTDIQYCKADGAYTNFICVDRKQLTTSQNLKEYELLLQDYNFIRCHHSYLINLSHVTEIKKSEGGGVKMTNGDTLPLSSRKRSSVLDALKARFIS